MWIKVRSNSPFQYSKIQLPFMLMPMVLCTSALNIILHSGKRVRYKHRLLPRTLV
jgi:hypothetical protein